MGTKLGIVIAAMAIVGAHYSMNSRMSVNESSAQISNSQYEVMARNAALAGYELAKQSLASSFSSNSFTGDVDGVSYRTTLKISGTTAKITSVGSYKGVRSNSDKSYMIAAEFSKLTGASNHRALPDYMKYALLSHDDFRVSGSAGTTHIHSTHPSAAKLNANIHTNGDLIVNGKGNARMNGFGTYAGAAGGKHINTKFQPNHNPDGLGNTHQAGVVDIPTIDVAAITTEWAPDHTITSGTISGAQSYGGTKNHPAIVYVPGDITISGTISGFVVFLVEGDITIAGNTTAGVTGNSDTHESSVAFYGEGNFDMTGGSDVWGQILVNGDFEMGGNARLYGSATTASTAWMHGTPDIYYREASSALTQVLGSAPKSDSVVRTAYAEF